MTSYLLAPELDAPDELDEPLAPESPPALPSVLPAWLAFVLFAVGQSFGMSAREAYLVESQRASFDAVVVPGVAAVVDLLAGAVVVAVLSVVAFFSLWRSPMASAEPLARAKRVVINRAFADLRIGASGWVGLLQKEV